MEIGSTPIAPARPPLCFGDITGEVIGAFYDVYNSLGYGFLESAYAGALQVEMLERGLSFRREHQLEVRYHDRVVGVYRADFLVEGVLVLELKTIAKVGHPERRQLLHYLKATSTRVGLILNFGPEAKFYRIANS
jgi:GxxExxY protein